MVDIQKLAELARLSVATEEAAGLQGDMERILAFVDQVQSRDASGVPASPDRVNVFREDAVAPLASAYDLVEAAPAHQDGFVKVPKIIE